MNKRKLNWWAIVAALIVGVPVGFVVTGIIDKTINKEVKEDSATEEVDTIPVVDTVVENFIVTDSVAENLPEVTAPETKVEEPRRDETINSKPAPKVETEKVNPKPVELTPEQKEEQARKKAEREELARQKALEEDRKKADRLAAEEAMKAEKARQAEELARQKAAEEAKKKQQAYDKLLSEVRSIVKSGKSSPKVPDGCPVDVNGKITNYQNFRNGVNLGTYSNIEVSKIEGEGSVTKVYVTAKTNSAND